MKFIMIGDIEAQLVGDQAFLYMENSSEVINIPGIESKENCEEILVREIEFLNSSSFGESIPLFE